MNFANHIEDGTQLFQVQQKHMLLSCTDNHVFYGKRNCYAQIPKKEVTTYSDVQESNVLGYNISRTISFKFLDELQTSFM